MRKLSKWFSKYYPTFLLLAEMAAIYLFVEWLLFSVLWPNALLNAEPAATVSRPDFRAAYRSAYEWLGLCALFLYGLYSLVGLPPMESRAHGKLGKYSRVAVIECDTILTLSVISTLLVIPGAENIWYFAIWGYSLASFGVYLWFLVRITINLSRNQYGIHSVLAGLAGIASLFASVAVATLLHEFSGVANILNDLFNRFQNGRLTTIPSYQGMFALRLPVDYILLILPFLSTLFLFILLRNASPTAVCLPEGHKPRALIYVNNLTTNREDYE